jgi:hypothetical protein
MNKWQRIVLVLGAIVLLLVIFKAPTVQHARDGIILRGGTEDILANVVDMRTALVRGLAVIAATILAFFALKSGGGAKVSIRDDSIGKSGGWVA